MIQLEESDDLVAVDVLLVQPIKKVVAVSESSLQQALPRLLLVTAWLAEQLDALLHD